MRKRDFQFMGYMDQVKPDDSGVTAGGSPAAVAPVIEPVVEPVIEPAIVPVPSEPAIGKAPPSDSEAALIKDMMKWKEKAREAERKAEELNTTVASISATFGDLKLDDVKALIEAQKDQERKKLEEKGEYDRIIQQVKEENEKAVVAKGEEVSTLQQQLNTLQGQIVEMTIGDSFSNSAFIGENSVLPPSIARKEFGTNFELVDGKIVGYDKPKGTAERTVIVNAQGDPKSFEEVIAQLYENHPDKKYLLKSKKKPGAASSTSTDSGLKPQAEKLYGIDRIAAGLKSREA